MQFICRSITISKYCLELIEQPKASHQYYRILFNAMASPCEVLIRSQDKELCDNLAILVITEVKRIEKKYSRFQNLSLLSSINSSNGKPVKIDKETYQLLNYAKEVFILSNGLFDITSGGLSKVWPFKKQTDLPKVIEIQNALLNVGFNEISYNKNSISLPENMQIDFGGIGKEYAVDQVAKTLDSHCHHKGVNFLINLGGDLLAKDYKKSNSHERSEAWKVGLENSKNGYINLLNGAIATSGTSQRSFVKNGKVYSHLLNPKTGWPIENPPSSVTCFAETCVLAGTYSSLAMLQGANAESFLLNENIKHILVDN